MKNWWLWGHHCLRKWKILEDLGKKMKDPWRSWQENEGSLKILTRILKILMKILKRILKGPHEDLVRSLKILERFSPGKSDQYNIHKRNTYKRKGYLTMKLFLSYGFALRITRPKTWPFFFFFYKASSKYGGFYRGKF